MRRPSLPSFLAGAVAAVVLAGVPATAVIRSAAVDANPNAFDGTAPSLSVEPVKFVTGASIDADLGADPVFEPCGGGNFSILMGLRCSGSAGTSGLAGYDIRVAGDWIDGEELVTTTSATSWRFSGTNRSDDCGDGARHGYYVIARDNRGNSAKSWWINKYPDVWQETGFDPNGSTAVRLSTRTGTWSTSNCTCFNGGHTLYSTASTAALTYKVTTTASGQTVALVMEKNTNRGKVNISVDGATATSVDTYASAPTHRVIVWQKTLSVGTHTLKLSNAGTVGRSRIDVDSIMLTR